QDAVEAAGGDVLPLAPGHADSGEEVRDRGDLLIARPVMDAIDLRAALLLQRLRGADIGLDHEFFDQLVRIEALAPLHARDLAVLENDLVLGRIDLERLALFPRRPDGAIRRPKRL